MEKALFAVYDLKTRKLTSKNVAVQYNPDNCKVNKANKTSVAAGYTGPTSHEFIAKEPTVLTMELLFDSYVHGAAKQDDVREAQECYKLLRTGLIQVDSDIHSPPAVQFSWGKLIFVGMLTKLEENYTMFSNSGLPVRAKVKLEIEGSTQEELNSAPNNSPDRTKIHTPRQGETLWEISEREYGSIGQWRVIARKNNISNPRRIAAAVALHIPALPGGVNQ